MRRAGVLGDSGVRFVAAMARRWFLESCGRVTAGGLVRHQYNRATSASTCDGGGGHGVVATLLLSLYIRLDVPATAEGRKCDCVATVRDGQCYCSAWLAAQIIGVLI